MHLRVKEADGITPCRLGLVHGDIGVLEQIFRTFQMAEEQADADTGRGAALIIPKHARLVQLTANFFRDQFGLGSRLIRLNAQLFQHHHEFVTAQPRHAVALAHTGLQPARRHDQQQIAHRMALRIVDYLEMIQVQKQQCAMLTAIACCRRSSNRRRFGSLVSGS